jgi:acetylglutamate kinase
MPQSEYDELMARYRAEAKVLRGALPDLRRYYGRSIVIKFGGHAMTDPALFEAFAKDMVLLRQVGIQPIVVHGGGPQINHMLDALDHEASFVDGLRVTDATTMGVVEMVLSGQVNKSIALAINRAGGRAVGISGKDGDLVRAVKVQGSHDLGFVGEPELVNPAVLSSFEAGGIIPVIAPIAADAEGQTHNINGDTMAGAIASAVGAARLLLLTDVIGVLDKQGHLMTEIKLDQVEALRADGTIKGGMIPKLETCAKAVSSGVGAAVILDGRIEGAVIVELLSKSGAGTLVRA